MDATIYEFLMAASAFVITILGVMLATTTIQPECGLEKLRKARNILIPSYFVLALLSMVCYFTGYDPHVEPTSTLFVASFQALLFTTSMLVFIRPVEVKWKAVLQQAAGITVGGIILFVALFSLTDYYSWFFYTGIAAYIAQLIIYTRKFMLAYRKTLQEVEDYYDEDQESRLRWVKVGFYSALAIGIMAICILFYIDWYRFFVPLYVVYYSFIVMWFVNYYRRMKFAIPVIATPAQNGQAVTNQQKEYIEETEAEDENEPIGGNIPPEIEQMLHERLQQYVDRKEYCRKDVPSEEVVAALGTTKTYLRRYMNDHYGMWFSTWRNELRIQEACMLWRKSPDISIVNMIQKIGYTNSGNFCRNFKKIVGTTPKEYCMQMRANPELSDSGC